MNIFIQVEKKTPESLISSVLPLIISGILRSVGFHYIGNHLKER